MPNGDVMFEAAARDHFKFDSIHYAFLKEHVKKYKLKNVLERSDIGKDSDTSLYIFDEVTSGPAESAYRILKSGVSNGVINADEPILIKDCDSFAKTDLVNGKNMGGNYVVIADLKKHNYINNIAAKSFATINENNMVTNIAEKNVISNYICAGMYGFKSAKEYIFAFEELKRTEFMDEIYISHIIKHLLDREPFKAVQANNFIDCGTYDDFINHTKSLATYFVDLDGTLWYNQSKLFNNHYGKAPIPIQEAVNYFLKKQQLGCRIIFTTSRPESVRSHTENILFEVLGFNKTIVIMGLPHTPRVIVNDSSRTNPGPTAIAMNPLRDSTEYWNGIIS